MYRVVPSKKFERSLRKIKRSGMFKPNVEESFNEAVNFLAEGTPLPSSYSDHALSGEWSGYRECHIKGDLLLIYQQQDDLLILVLADIGSHSQLFG